MPKQNYKNSVNSAVNPFRALLFVVSALAIIAGASFFASRTPLVNADANCSSITECQRKIDSNNDAVAALESQATSFRDAIAHLNAQIVQIQGAISANQAKQANLEHQIKVKQAEINRQREILGSSLKAMYVDDQMSTIEMLATSKSLSEYVDKEEYRSAVQNKIQESLKQIAELQRQLQAKKTQVDALLKQQQAQRAQLAAAHTKQQRMLSYNESQQEAYNRQTADNAKKLDQLIAAQLAANRSGNNGALIAGSSSYPYANAGFGMSTAPGCVDNDGPDAWGYCTRQCVSYAAWAVAHSGRTAPDHYGNARDWVWHALADGVPVYSFNNVEGYANVRTGGPQAGDVAISTRDSYGNPSTWGHAMYIEGVSGTQIYVSQYNAALTGEFSHQWRDASNYYFIRFQ